MSDHSCARIGNHFLNSSIGFCGSFFQILNLVCLCETYGLQGCATCWHQVVIMNDYQKKRFSEMMVLSMFGTVTRKKVTVFGYAFKKDMWDMRKIPSMFVIRDLVLTEVKNHVYDPQVSHKDMLTETKNTCNMSAETQPMLEAAVTTATGPCTICEGAHVLAMLIKWIKFKGLDRAHIYKSMAKHVVFDGRNILDHYVLQELGFEVHLFDKLHCMLTQGDQAAQGKRGRGGGHQVAGAP